MILGHLTGTYLIVKVMKPKATPLIMASTLIGAYFPDMVDKTLMLLNIGNGRFIAHSLPMLSLFLVFCFWVVNTKLKEHLSLFLWFCLGCFLHLLQDWVQLKTLFWPFLGGLDGPVSRSLIKITVNFYSFKTSPLIWAELVTHGLFVIYQIVTFTRKYVRK